jgi:hypothetical protein
MKYTGTPLSDSTFSASATASAAGEGVVADPGLEQVAEDVQRIGAGRLLAQEAQEQVGDLRTAGVQVQVGNEQRGHARILGHQR